jgi:hypothetical protein
MLIDVNQYYRILPIKQAVEQKLIALPGVTGVDVGLKRVGGEDTSVHAILVFVAHKGVFEPQHRIPERIEGVPTDVIEAVFTHDAAHEPVLTAPAVDAKRYDPCQGGAMISPARFNNMYGSLGMIVRDASTNQQLWLSCYHVLCVDANWNAQGVDKRIVQPSVSRGGNPATDTIGSIVNGKYGQIVVDWGYDLYVDCAVCDTGGRAASSNIVMLGTPKGPANAQINDLVTKYGATSELTYGSVNSTNLTVSIGGYWFYYQYRIVPAFAGGQTFAVAGDSGSVALDSSQRAIGLCMSANEAAKTTTVNPIGQIIDALNIVVPG